MQYIKINNLFKGSHKADYKGLDLSKIIPGTQIYPNNEDVAYFAYFDEVPEHPDIEVITEQEYNEVKEIIHQEMEKIVTPEKKIEQLEQQIIAQQLAINMLLGV